MLRLARRLTEVLPLDDAVAAARLFWHLPGYLRHPIGLERSRAITRGWVERREADFLALVRDAIFAYPSNPYRRLLRLAGCELGDLERLVAGEGLEGALLVLFERGVYLTVDELKGRGPVVRGSARFGVQPTDLLPPGLVGLGTNQSSGSRGARTMVRYGLAHIRILAVTYCVELGARGGLGWDKGIWEVPGGAIEGVLRYSGFGAPLARWFSLVDAAAPGLDPRYRLAERALQWGGLLAGVRLPRSEYVPFDDPLPIARWMAALLRKGRVPHLYAFLSPAVRLCQTAAAIGLDLSGAQLTVTGEPLTPARVAAIRRAGATVVSRYGSVELGQLGSACLAPAWTDEHHVPASRIALIRAGSAGPARGLPPDALLGSSLRAAAPLIVLNLSTGDQATLTQRDCGCELEGLGWTTHLHGLRSFEKLTAAGMTFLEGDVIRVLEELLPARFGGGPTDYQLVDGEAADGQPALRLLVDPAIEPLDEVALAEAFLEAIGSGSGAERVMGLVWRTPGLLRVERRPPLRTASGKVLHVHRAGPVASEAT